MPCICSCSIACHFTPLSISSANDHRIQYDVTTPPEPELTPLSITHTKLYPPFADSYTISSLSAKADSVRDDVYQEKVIKAGLSASGNSK